MTGPSSRKATKGLLQAFLALLVISLTALTVGAQEVTPPGKPGFLSSIPSENKMQLAWAHPASNGGSMITGWELQLVSASTSESYIISGSGTLVTIAGLINGQVYEIRVRAKNPAGYGPFSDSIQSTPYSALLSPQNMRSEVDGQNVKLEWEPPLANGTPVIGYKLELWSYDNAQAVFTGPSSVVQLGVVSSYTFSDLVFDEEYKFFF